MSRTLQVLCLLALISTPSLHAEEKANKLAIEAVSGQGLWIHDKVTRRIKRGPIKVKIWFDKQVLGRGDSYLKRAKTLKGWTRQSLRSATVKTLKELSDKNWQAVGKDFQRLIKSNSMKDLERHWIINGVTCTIDQQGLAGLKKIPSVKKIFFAGAPRANKKQKKGAQNKGLFFPPTKTPKPYDPNRYKHPWYIRYLLADKVWSEFNVTGKGTLNIIHDGNFLFNDNLKVNLYRKRTEIPGNGIDDDKNGLIDDYHGYNFSANNANLSPRQPGQGRASSLSHGFMCAAIISGAGSPGKNYEFGVAPQSQWAGLIAGSKIEAAVEWAIEEKADTYSMSFSIPNLGEYRSHWRKVLEHGSLCGLYFVSGAGNFAKTAQVPVQMRIPEDIPNVVFAAAGIRRDFGRTSFSSQGPVLWNTEHYKDGLVQKPAVCAFNQKLPRLKSNGQVKAIGSSGNSFAGPMYCGTISLMLSADPDLLPWDLRAIITSTATDVGPKGVDHQTGHGLINCYRAVKEVLRQKAIRTGKNSKKYTGRKADDSLKKSPFTNPKSMFFIDKIRPHSQSAHLELKVNDQLLRINGQNIQQIDDFERSKKLNNKQWLRFLFIREKTKLKLELCPPNFGFTLREIKKEDPIFR
jgi:hypothetical protein